MHTSRLATIAAVPCLVAVATGACGSSPDAAFPSGLQDNHVLLAIDYVVNDPVLDGVYDPRIVTLAAEGTLVLERRDFNSMMGTTATKLDAAGLQRAWSATVASGMVRDGLLALPGFASQTVTTATHIFRVNDGTRSTQLMIDDLGSEQIFAGDPPIPASERGLRAAAIRLTDELRAMGDPSPWTPPALLLWWRRELPADATATVTPWSGPIDLGSAGEQLVHPVWDRCVRLDGADAAAVAELARALPIEHLVEQDGTRYALNVRPIHLDELDGVDCS